MYPQLTQRAGTREVYEVLREPPYHVKSSHEFSSHSIGHKTSVGRAVQLAGAVH